MSVGTQNGYSGPYTANGVTTAFGFTFSVLTSADVSVILRDAAGVETTASPSLYTVSLTGPAPSPGTVTFLVAPIAGIKVIPILAPAFTQDTQFENGSGWNASPVNNVNDRAALRDQVLKREVERAIKVPIGDTVPSLGTLAADVASTGANATAAAASAGAAATSAGNAATSAGAASTSAGAAATSASAASTSAGNAAGSATAASTSAGNAATSASNAQAAAAYRVSIAYSTYAELAAVVGTAGQSGAVFSDAGTHTDPVVGGTVSNNGVYAYSTSPAGWRRLAALPAGATIDTDGTLAANSDAVVPSQKATKTYADTKVPGTRDTDGTMAANSNTAVPSQAAVRTYVASLLAGLSWKQAVRAATTANGTLSTAYANGQAIDGVTLATGDRILVKDQTTASENGIYIVPASGAPTRATDADAGAELVNASCYVSEGTVNADTQWVCTNNAPITPGSTSLVFVQFSASGGGETTAKIASNQTTTSVTAVNITGLSFTPAANKVYEVNVSLMVNTTQINTFKIGVAWPSSLTIGQALIDVSALTVNSTSFQTNNSQQAEIDSTATYLSSGLNFGTVPRLMRMKFFINAGASPSGSLQLQYASNGTATAGILAGSFMRVKEIT